MVLQYFTALSIGIFILHVVVWMATFAVIFGFILANRPGWKDEIRALSIMIAVLSILYFALEQRSNQLSRETEDSITAFTDIAVIRSGEFDREIKTYCGFSDPQVEALNEEAKIINEYCGEMEARRDFIRTLTGTRRIERGEVNFSVILDRPNYTQPHKVLETRIRDANTKIIDDYTAVQQKIVADSDSRLLDSFFYVFVALFAAGAGIDVGSELREWFKKIRGEGTPDSVDPNKSENRIDDDYKAL